MLLPPQYAWAEPVAIGAAVVFTAAWLGHSLFAGSRLLTALASALVFALVFGPLAYFRVATLSITIAAPGLLPAAKPAAPPSPAQPPPAPKPPANPVTTIPNQ